MSRVITKTRTGNIISDEELGLEYLFVGGTMAKKTTLRLHLWDMISGLKKLSIGR